MLWDNGGVLCSLMWLLDREARICPCLAGRPGNEAGTVHRVHSVDHTSLWWSTCS